MIRLAAPLSSVMPINDGGLFYTMIEDLVTNHYRLPLTTTYNQAQIPFAYPPLALYAYALIMDLTGLSLLDLLRVLPTLISILTIPAFYVLAKEILDSKVALLLAVAAFAFIPRSYIWLIMGGGATRALGYLFALLAIRQTYRLFRSGHLKDALPAILLSSLVVLSHPEAAFHTLLSSLFFYVWKDRSKTGFLHSLLVAGGVFITTAPWWLMVTIRHGLDTLAAPAIAVSQDNISLLMRLFNLFIFRLTEEPFLNLFGVLGLIGIFILLAKRQFFIPIWLFILYIIEPRSAPLYMMIPLAMGFGYGMEKIILPRLSGLDALHGSNQGETTGSDRNLLLEGQIAKIFIGFLFAYGVMSNYYTGSQMLSKFTLNDQDRDALAWAQTTSTDSRFLVITQEKALLDPSSDWFPALAGRTSVGTVYGYEWVSDGQFDYRLTRARALQNCATQGISCLDMWQREYGETYDYVYIRKVQNGELIQVPLIVDLRLSSQFEKVYETNSVVIFERKPMELTSGRPQSSPYGLSIIQ